MMTANQLERLVDAIGAALGVDTGTIAESRWCDAMSAARRITGETQAELTAQIEKDLGEPIVVL
jgi:hypothetical protein